MGTSPRELEKALEINFALATRWGCILLLDEADVFLSQRTMNDVTRNALVAVFLRILEYHSGVLFLTTNRVGSFDEAFMSRIHISLHYPAFTMSETMKVFEHNLDLIQRRYTQSGRPLRIFRPSIMEYVSGHIVNTKSNWLPFHPWNGRQIRNACQTAIALAELSAREDPHDNTVYLKADHFRVPHEASMEFNHYLDAVRGANSFDSSRLERRDDWPSRDREKRPPWANKWTQGGRPDRSRSQSPIASTPGSNISSVRGSSSSKPDNQNEVPAGRIPAKYENEDPDQSFGTPIGIHMRSKIPLPVFGGCSLGEKISKEGPH
ncbi:hypothetical protein GCG54_00015167 [Colletotrichum gloeosporioides]|uniref:ATPase AAA-type core domain-containing protein n=1 Tax=Colletotrichum gloeosporioides TaxID=474922 RepID=A0A8H4CDD5_COLGL|nr:uncharacterized protein GCG54_00015167 [Colletotrichum gloeosporioides]KAF3801945.1 hypothetical protein GCG54_00015167 [Colletotrichum gloeosporioides]